jgi:hypothetical protein
MVPPPVQEEILEIDGQTKATADAVKRVMENISSQLGYMLTI